MRVLFLLVPALACFCQPQTPGIDRPKIGVVLEGGGALGLAHIGVLQWFEEHRIPIDYLAGTSMGGLVGGMYATGMPAAELQDLVSTIDWSEALDGRPRIQPSPFAATNAPSRTASNSAFATGSAGQGD